MQPVVIELPDHTKGDEWEGMEIGPVTFNEGPPPADLVSCKMYFRLNCASNGPSSPVALKFKTSPDVGDETITILDASTWEILVPPTVINITIGDYAWDFETVDANGSPRTLYSGILTITPEYTYD